MAAMTCGSGLGLIRCDRLDAENHRVNVTRVHWLQQTPTESERVPEHERTDEDHSWMRMRAFSNSSDAYVVHDSHDDCQQMCAFHDALSVSL